MGFRFRRSLKIAPGVRLNVSKSGISTSLGGPGATVNLGKKGIRTTVGLPGTGLSYTSQSSSSSPSEAQALIEAPIEEHEFQTPAGTPVTMVRHGGQVLVVVAHHEAGIPTPLVSVVQDDIGPHLRLDDGSVVRCDEAAAGTARLYLQKASNERLGTVVGIIWQVIKVVAAFILPILLALVGVLIAIVGGLIAAGGRRRR